MPESTLNRRKTDNRIVLIQYICAIMVVFLHSVTYNSWSLSREQHALSFMVQDFFCSVNLLAVPSFLFISGYFMFVHYDPKRYGAFLKKRFFTLAVPFVLWNALNYAVYFGVQQIPAFGATMNRNAIPLNLVYFLKRTFLSGGFAPLWYIREIFIYSVLSIGLYYLLKNKYVALGVIAALLAVNFVLKDYYEPLYWLPLFLTGGFAGMHVKRYEFTGEKKRLKTALGAAALAAAVALNQAALYTGMNYSKVTYLCRAVMGILFPVVMTSVLKKGLSLKWCFTISLFIYCSHGFIMQCLQKIYLLLLGTTTATSLLCYFTAPVIAVILITCGAVFLRRFLPPVWKILNGGRAA